MRYARWLSCAWAGVVLISTGPCLADQPAAVQIADGVKAVMMPNDDRRDGILTVYDDDIFVQCVSSHFLPDWRCEAAGLGGQPWIHTLLTPERQETLKTLGFTPGEQFGNFIGFIPRTTTPDALAANILQLLNYGYGIKPEDVRVHSEWLKSARCHHRIMANHERGGSIRTPKWGFAVDVEKSCGMASNTGASDYDDLSAVIPEDATGIDLEARYIPAMAAGLRRLDEAKTGNPYVIFDAGPAYVQCEPDREDKSMYCEAASDEAVGKPLERILTPARKASLIAAGFEPPGKVINYRRLYPRDQYDVTAVAKALLDVLKVAYGYHGTPAMNVETETGSKRPLAP